MHQRLFAVLELFILMFSKKLFLFSILEKQKGIQLIKVIRIQSKKKYYIKLQREIERISFRKKLKLKLN